MGTILASDVVDDDLRDVGPREVEEMFDVNPTFTGLQAERVSARVKNDNKWTHFLVGAFSTRALNSSRVGSYITRSRP
jgi:hypothetical protein